MVCCLFCRLLVQDSSVAVLNVCILGKLGQSKPMKRRVLIAGVNGLIGHHLVSHFHRLGWAVSGLARHSNGFPPHCQFLQWDGQSLGDWVDELDGCDVLINLAGRSVNCRHNQENRHAILRSRIESTQVLAEAVAGASTPPDLWINASGVSIYRSDVDIAQDESQARGAGFMADVVEEWEASFFKDNLEPSTRRVALRTSMVLADEPGNPYRYFCQLAKWGLGGKIGNGEQMVSWIHIDDVCGVVEWVVEHPQLEGVVNMTSPTPLPQKQMMAQFRRYTGTRIGIPAMGWMARLGAYLLGMASELILTSVWVTPGVLLKQGYTFKYPRLEPWSWGSEGKISFQKVKISK